jgi:multidrug efflux pump subunit AcrB
MPLGLTFTKVTDQAVNITEAYDEFMLKFFVALAVVIAVSLASLGFRVGIVVALAVPLTLAGGVRDHAGHRPRLRPHHPGRADPVAGPAGRRRHHHHRDHRREDGGRPRPDRRATYAWGHTAAPMLAGTLVTIIGLMPVGFAKSSAGEYAGNIFWVVAFALITSWFVAVIFTPYLGVLLLPKIKPVAGGHAAIYDTPRYRQLRS